MVLSAFSFEWYDAVFMSTLLVSTVLVFVDWNEYDSCPESINMWLVADFLMVFLFRCFLLLDSWIIKKLRRPLRDEDRLSLFTIRIPVIWILCFVLYPFLWVWSFLGSLWLGPSISCFPDDTQVIGFRMWLILSYFILISGFWGVLSHFLERRKMYQLLVAQGVPEIPMDKFLFELLRNPDFPENIIHSRMIAGAQGGDVADSQRNTLSPVERAIVQQAIDQLPRYKMTKKITPNSTISCPICLEDFNEESEVRSLPCAHIFHVPCIDEWLVLNLKCPQCRCDVFPSLQFHISSSPSEPHRNVLLEGGQSTSDTIQILPPQLQLETSSAPGSSISSEPTYQPRWYRSNQPRTPNHTPNLSQQTTPRRSPFPTPRLSPQETPNMSPRQRAQPSPSLLSVLLENSNSSEQIVDEERNPPRSRDRRDEESGDIESGKQ